MAKAVTRTKSPKRKKGAEAFFETIIVGADFSKRSKKVFEQALEMAKRWPVKIVLAHVAPYTSYDAYMIGAMPSVALPTPEEDQARLMMDLKKYYSTARKKNVTCEVAYGDPAEDLILLAKKYPHPLILVGHTDKSAISRWALGSVSRDLAMNSPVPVWIQ